MQDFKKITIALAFRPYQPVRGEHNLRPFILRKRHQSFLRYGPLISLKIENKALHTRDIITPAGPKTEPSVTATTLPGLERQS